MVFLLPVRIRILLLLSRRGSIACLVEDKEAPQVIMLLALLTYFQEASLWMTFLVVNSMVPQILVVDLVRLVSGTVVNLVELVVHQLLI